MKKKRVKKTRSLQTIIRDFMEASVPVDGQRWKWERLNRELERKLKGKQK